MVLVSLIDLFAFSIDCVNDFLESEKYYEEAISLPIHTLLTVEEQDYVIENVLNFLSRQNNYAKNSKITDNKGFQNIF